MAGSILTLYPLSPPQMHMPDPQVLSHASPRVSNHNPGVSTTMAFPPVFPQTIPDACILLQESISGYAPFVARHAERSGGLLHVPAAVLANLCVAYVMLSENEAAEDIMRGVAAEEEVKST